MAGFTAVPPRSLGDRFARLCAGLEREEVDVLFPQAALWRQAHIPFSQPAGEARFALLDTAHEARGIDDPVGPRVTMGLVVQ